MLHPIEIEPFSLASGSKLTSVHALKALLASGSTAAMLDPLPVEAGGCSRAAVRVGAWWGPQPADAREQSKYQRWQGFMTVAGITSGARCAGAGEQFCEQSRLARSRARPPGGHDSFPEIPEAP